MDQREDFRITSAQPNGRTIFSKRFQALEMRNPLTSSRRRQESSEAEDRLDLKKRAANETHNDVAETSSVESNSAGSSNEPLDGGKRASSTRKSSNSLEFIVEQLNRRLSTLGKRVLQVMLVLFLVNLVILLAPMEEPRIEPKKAPARPRPSFTGPLAINEQLEASEILFRNQFHAPESMAWRADKRAFYTGVEGGFILLVEPYEERWQVVARLNGRGSVRDLSHNVRFVGSGTDEPRDQGSEAVQFAPFCEQDIKLYGKRAEFEPSLVSLSRCSRPLGVRLAPNGSHLYANDPLSGLYRIELGGTRPQVSKLIDFAAYQDISKQSEASERVVFADDIAVDWAADSDGSDVVYMTDCSRRWSVRYLLRLMIENDDSGRLLRFRVGERKLDEVGPLTPVSLAGGSLDWRNLSFPNGVELTANRSALLISDLNNRRILVHHLHGPLAGQTLHLLWVAGYTDNIRRGLDLADGQPTYWAACGCAVGDGYFEIAEFFNQLPALRKSLLKLLHYTGSFVEWLGASLDSTFLTDAGFQIKAGWLRTDPYCTHGLVFQFTEQGQLLRSLHAPHLGSHFRLLSEAHQVPLFPAETEPDSPGWNGNSSSALYLGSVYYSYLGRVKLGPIR